jgi:membrane-bound ClpP family serine protease
METLYLILFLIGIAYAVITIFVGDIFNIHFDLGGGHLPFLSPTTIGSFVTVFSGMGYFLTVNTDIQAIVIAIIAIVAAIFISMLMFFFIVLPLHHSDKTAAYSSKDMIGKQAEVITSIEPGSKGEIIYEQGGSRLSAPAMSADEMPIRQGELVTIVGEVSGTFIVE